MEVNLIGMLIAVSWYTIIVHLKRSKQSIKVQKFFISINQTGRDVIPYFPDPDTVKEG